MGQLSVDLSAKMESLKTKTPKKNKTGISFPRHFTAKLESGKTPYDEIQWETRTASIGNDKGSVIFEQRDVEVPVDWSQTATNIVASKYFYGETRDPRSARPRCSNWCSAWWIPITDWGKKDGYFKTAQDGENFRMELAHLMLTQKACFNSPVWFNVGVKETRGYGWNYDEQQGKVTKLEDGGVMRPQCSACFIVSVKDSLESILDLAKTEGMLFKWGSGTGSNLSALREEDASPLRRRTRQRTAQLHEGLRRIRRRHQERRQDAARGENGDPQRRITPMSTSSSGARRRKRRRRTRWWKPATIARWTAKRTVRSSSRTPTTACAPATNSWKPPARRRLVDEGRVYRPAGEALQGEGPDAPDCRSHAPVRRPGHAVRYHREPLASVQEYGAHQRVEPLLGIHVPRRFGLQSLVAESDEVRGTGRAVRCRGLPPRRGYDDSGAGNHRR